MTRLPICLALLVLLASRSGADEPRANDDLEKQNIETALKLTRESVKQQRPDDVSLTYLHNLAKKEPQNTELQKYTYLDVMDARHLTHIAAALRACPPIETVDRPKG